MKSLQYIALSNLPDDDLWALFLDISKARGINLRVLEKHIEKNFEDICVIRTVTWERDLDVLQLNDNEIQLTISKDSIYECLLKSDLKFISTNVLEKTYKILEHILSRTSHISEIYEYNCLFREKEVIDGKEILICYCTNLSSIFNMYGPEHIWVSIGKWNRLSLHEILFTQKGYETFCKEWDFCLI